MEKHFAPGEHSPEKAEDVSDEFISLNPDGITRESLELELQESLHRINNLSSVLLASNSPSSQLAYNLVSAAGHLLSEDRAEIIFKSYSRNNSLATEEIRFALNLLEQSPHDPK